MKAGSLHRKLVAGVMAALAVLSLGVVLFGMSVHEGAERSVWRTLLDIELDQAIQRLGPRAVADPALSGTLRLYDGGPAAPFPQALQGLPPGLHDDLEIDGHEAAVLVRDAGARRFALALDIGEFERIEMRMATGIAVSAVALVLLAGLALTWHIARLLRPLDRLAAQIAELPAHGRVARLSPVDGATAELALVRDALDGFLQRQADELDRERAFLHVASHELRTPVAVVATAAELALGDPALPPGARAQVQRIDATAGRMEELLGLLLLLARSPARLAATADVLSLPALVADVVDDHRPLLAGRELALEADLDAALPPLRAPAALARVAIGNLLRNAIEHSGAGTIRVRLQAPATVLVDDPGQGLPAARIAALYADAARGAAARDGAPGIGLPLLARLCEHLGWTLAFEDDGHGGTRSRLVLRDAAADDATPSSAA